MQSLLDSGHAGYCDNRGFVLRELVSVVVVAELSCGAQFEPSRVYEVRTSISSFQPPPSATAKRAWLYLLPSQKKICEHMPVFVQMTPPVVCPSLPFPR